MKVQIMMIGQRGRDVMTVMEECRWRNVLEQRIPTGFDFTLDIVVTKFECKKTARFRKAGHRGATIMYRMWEIMCFEP